jgi:hypothetical protein
VQWAAEAASLEQRPRRQTEALGVAQVAAKIEGAGGLVDKEARHAASQNRIAREGETIEPGWEQGYLVRSCTRFLPELQQARGERKQRRLRELGSQLATRGSAKVSGSAAD